MGWPRKSTPKSSVSPLERLVFAENERLEAERRSRDSRYDDPSKRSLPLMEWIPSISKKRQSPFHLKPAVDILETFRESPFEFCFSVPPRHGKTELVLHFLVWALVHWPELNTLYVSYNQAQGISKGRRALSIAGDAGLLLQRATGEEWQTSQNEFSIWTGVGGPYMGKGFQLIVVDDPYRNRAEAESPVIRERVWDMYQSDLMSRLEPGGSIVTIHQRWHPDDLIGRLLAGDVEEDRPPVEGVLMPAIAHENTSHEVALWPERWGLEYLHRRRARVGPYAWSSMYQGEPRPRGATVFGEPTFYMDLPKEGQLAQGLDLAYSEKTTSDSSVVVTMKKVGDKFYITRVRREEMRAPEFKKVLRMERAFAPGTTCRIYAAGTETGAIDFMRSANVVGGKVIEPGIQIEALQPVGDKFTRAIPFAAAWNDHRVLVPDPSLVSQLPSQYGWVSDFLDELRGFTGVKDTHDDQVDAVVAAYDVLGSSVVALPPRNPRASSPRRV